MTEPPVYTDEEVREEIRMREERGVFLRRTGKTLQGMFDARPDGATVYAGLSEEEGGTALGIFLDYRALGLDETRAFTSTIIHVAGWIANKSIDALSPTNAA